MGFIEVMKERQMLAQVTHEEELRTHLQTGTRSAYVGFDPTADSLHVGSLMPIYALRRWQQAGHRVICVLGGGTGMIGDPSGKTEMRKMLMSEELHANLAAIAKQLGIFLNLDDPAKGIVVNNADWLTELNYLTFLREIGPHFSVNRMLTAECFKQRLEKGLSFLEFNYMILQSYDFLHLYRDQNCTVQLGGDDQWSNMLGGVELIRRLTPGKAFCLTAPLLTTSDGRKMGKTESGAVWLDGAKTSPYEYYQYWRNAEDGVVGQCLRYFTDLPIDRIEQLEQLSGQDINRAKEELAFACTAALHGAPEAEKARATAADLFSSRGGGGEEPQHFISADAFASRMAVLDFLTVSGVFSSKAEVRRLIQQRGLALNGKKIDDMNYIVELGELNGATGCLVKKGKKHYYRIRISE